MYARVHACNLRTVYDVLINDVHRRGRGVSSGYCQDTAANGHYRQVHGPVQCAQGRALRLSRLAVLARLVRAREG